MVMSHPWGMERISFPSSETQEFNSSFENPSSRCPIDLRCPSISGVFRLIQRFHRSIVEADGPVHGWDCSELLFTQSLITSSV